MGNDIKVRGQAFGQARGLTWVDRFGVWLSGVQIRRYVGNFRGLRIGDFGCGYNASFARTVLPKVAAAVLVDVSLADDLKSRPGVRTIEGALPGALRQVPDGSLDVVLCMSVLEHLSEPQVALQAYRRILAPGGVLLINVPSWRGKWFLEFSAFKLGLSPLEEMDDHKAYYDPRDLWPLLVRAGFIPHNIKCFTHKFGLNTFAVCRVEDHGRAADRPGPQ
jgi:SAM-dependent methyltransferase